MELHSSECCEVLAEPMLRGNNHENDKPGENNFCADTSSTGTFTRTDDSSEIELDVGFFLCCALVALTYFSVFYFFGVERPFDALSL